MKYSLHSFLTFIIWVWIGPLSAQENNLKDFYPPQRGIPRYLDDYSELGMLNVENPYLKLKYIPFTKKSYLSVGGEIKYRYEYFNNYRLGNAEQDLNGHLLHRYMLHSDFHISKWFRVFSQFNYTDASWRNPGPMPIDRDRLSLHQLFLELGFEHDDTEFRLQAGRREYSFGKKRWMDSREGPNTRLSFDGLNITIRSGFELNLFLIAPVKIGPDFFDNETLWDEKRIGFYSMFNQLIPHHNLDIYGLYFESPDRYPHMGNTAHKTAFGIRDKMVWPRIEIDMEGMLQLGLAEDTTSTASMIGFDFRIQPFKEYEKLKFGLESLYTSGKRNSHTMTYKSLHPSNFNTKNIDLFGKHNLTYLEPFLLFTPSKNDILLFETGFYLKSSRLDNIYIIPGKKLYGPDEFGGSFLGTQFNLIYTRFWNPFLQTQAGYCHFRTSSEFKEAASAVNTDFLYVSVTCKF